MTASGPAAIDSVLPHGAGRASDGRLTIGGCALADLAEVLGTPALVVDESDLRSRAREYRRAFDERRGEVSVLFASKALSCSAIIAVMAQEGLGCDVSSSGELAVALAGEMRPERILLHGNAKRDQDLAAAIRAGVGLVVIDSLDEIVRLERAVSRDGRAGDAQPVLLRVNPGIVAPTHAAMATGDRASKFGLDADSLCAAAEQVARSPRLRLEGLHVHVGSQITDLTPFTESVRAIGSLPSLPEMAMVDLGGGLGVRYRPDDPEVPSVDAYADALVSAARTVLPARTRLIIEPGRSLVAQAMVTVYRVVSVKRAARTFVAVDGGMADNLEPMMYGTPFAPFVLDREGPSEVCDVVGPHCEAGDRLVQAWPLVRPAVDDLIVVPVTGAYCHALANNYNGALRPPVVLCHDGHARVVQRRETIADLLTRNCSEELKLPAWR